MPVLADAIPEMHLDVYYGFDNWLATVGKRDSFQRRRIDSLLEQIRRLKGWVNLKGKVNQRQLAEAWKKAYVWAFPTTFQESFCLTAKEACLSSTPIVSTHRAALKTTVGRHGYVLKNYPYSLDGANELIAQVIKLHKNRKHWLEQSKLARKGAVGLGWQKRWDDHWSRQLV